MSRYIEHYYTLIAIGKIMKAILKLIRNIWNEWTVSTKLQMFIVLALCGIGVYACADLMSGI
jgi:hypothetical protein